VPRHGSLVGWRFLDSFAREFVWDDRFYVCIGQVLDALVCSGWSTSGGWAACWLAALSGVVIGVKGTAPVSLIVVSSGRLAVILLASHLVFV